MKIHKFVFFIFFLAGTLSAARYSWNGMLYTNVTVNDLIEAITETTLSPTPTASFFWNGTTYDDATVAKMITVITTTNPVPSIPSTKHIYPTQKSLFRIPALGLCKKIIVFDGIQPGFEDRADDYEQYKQALRSLTQTDPIFSNTELIFCEKWVHLSGAIREAMAHVTTPYVLIHQHDFVLVNDFELNGLIATMEANRNIKYVRLAHPANVHWVPSGDVDQVVIGPSFVPLLRHYGWSDNDHVATTEYYNDFVLPLCGHGPMENYLETLFQQYRTAIGNACQPIFGTYVYGTLSDGEYVYHSDGRCK